jgi:hypothetical protein
MEADELMQARRMFAGYTEERALRAYRTWQENGCELVISGMRYFDMDGQEHQHQRHARQEPHWRKHRKGNAK